MLGARRAGGKELGQSERSSKSQALEARGRVVCLEQKRWGKVGWGSGYKVPEKAEGVARGQMVEGLSALVRGLDSFWRILGQVASAIEQNVA